MVNTAAIIGNLARKTARRLLSLHKPLVRRTRRRARAKQHAAMALTVTEIEQELGRIAARRAPVIAGPWLAEVGYEVLYWIPFLRWVQHRYRIAPQRLVIVSRGGIEPLYAGIAEQYIDLFDHMSPTEFAAGGEARQRVEEGGGRKQSAAGGAFDRQVLRAVTDQADPVVLHPSLMFRLFREVWQGNLPLDTLWRHTTYGGTPRPPRPAVAGLPERYVAVKFYSGTALRRSTQTCDALRGLVAAVARSTPVVVLDTGVAFDDHSDYTFAGLPGVISACAWMTPRNNLGLQASLIAHADRFISTCGGLAWVAPLMGTPTTAVYEDDRLLTQHLLIARQAGRRAGAAEFGTLDLREYLRFV
ncbi:MAG TPA: hypothetical protein VN654_19445 [Vicinamibacterales bacterium]|nr:hypothetical protein [Vicinamibacterales bacterium]